MKIGHLVRVYDEDLWVWLKHQAVTEGRRPGQIVENALRMYRSGTKQATEASPHEVSPGSTRDHLQALMDGVPTRPMKTTRQLALEREARRGDDSGSQDPDDGHD